MIIERIRARLHGCWRRFTAQDKLDAIFESQGYILEVESRGHILTHEFLEKLRMSIDDIQTAEAAEHTEIVKLRDTVNKAVDALTHAQGETSNPELHAKIQAVLDAIHGDTEDIKAINASTTAAIPATQDVAETPPAQADTATGTPSSQDVGNTASAIGNVGNSTTLGEAA